MRDRAKIVPLASGDVLELGCGAPNLDFYDWNNVHSLSGVDPSEELLANASRALESKGLTANFMPGIAEALPFADASFDTVVTTFTLCSVQDPRLALSEAKRVLRPNGRLLFVEHGRAPDPSAAAWQKHIEPFWKRIAGGCHLTRPVTQAISAAGFVCHAPQGHYMTRTPKWLGWVEWGEARLAGSDGASPKKP
jgi:ubiquinone/menaquinone biosynthesis C-methylase UbiE